MLLPVLHGSYDGPFLLAWDFAPPIVIGLLFAAMLYAVALRRARAAKRSVPPAWQITAYYAGLGFIAIALLGPLDTWNDEFFFLHMAQHLLLIQAAAPLVLLGRPVQVFLRGLPVQRSGQITHALLGPVVPRTILTTLAHPLVAFVLFNGSMIVWHLPRFYDAALENSLVHDIEHISFLGTALIFWWSLIEPVPRHLKLKLPWALASLFFTAMVGTAVGAVITLSASVIYGYYLDGVRPWGLSTLEDQQVGGLLMWVAGGLVYASIIIGIFVARLNQDAADDDALSDAAYDAAHPSTEEPQHASRPL